MTTQDAGIPYIYIQGIPAQCSRFFEVSLKAFPCWIHNPFNSFLEKNIPAHADDLQITYIKTNVQRISLFFPGFQPRRDRGTFPPTERKLIRSELFTHRLTRKLDCVSSCCLSIRPALFQGTRTTLTTTTTWRDGVRFNLSKRCTPWKFCFAWVHRWCYGNRSFFLEWGLKTVRKWKLIYSIYQKEKKIIGIT